MKQDATRLSLLRAARRAFARHGYEGASVRGITRTARANLGAITYHFGSKRKLYELVVQSCAQPLADAVIAATRASGTPAQRVEAVVRTYFEYLASNQDIAHLVLQELVLGSHPPEAAMIHIKRMHAALTTLVQDGQREGAFRPGDARIMAISIVSQPLHMNLVRRALKTSLGVDLDDENTRALVVEHAVAYACAGLGAGGK